MSLSALVEANIYACEDTQTINTCFSSCKCNLASDTIKCSDFTSFDELDLNQTPKIKCIELEPNVSQPLDNRLDLSHLQFELNAKIVLKNLLGFSDTQNPFEVLTKSLNMSLFIDKSTVEHLPYQNQTTSPQTTTTTSTTSTTSTTEHFFTSSTETTAEITTAETTTTLDESTSEPILYARSLSAYFSAFALVDFSAQVKFASKINPNWFKNVQNFTLRLKNLSSNNAFVLDTNIDINPIDYDVGALEIDSSTLRNLSQTLLNEKFFSKLSRLVVSSSDLDSISDGLFKSFDSLGFIGLDLNNMDSFLNGSFEWMYSLNPSICSQFVLGLSDKSGKYAYPEQDLCRFRHFPHDRNVFPKIESSKALACNCTLIWLLKNVYKYKDFGLLNSSSVYGCIKDERSLNDSIKNCNFEKRFKECDNEVEETSTMTVILGSFSNNNNKDEELVQTLIISLSSVGAGFIVVVFVCVFFYYKYRKLRSFRSDVAYEIGAFNEFSSYN